MHTAWDMQGHRKNVYDLEFQSHMFEIRKLFQHFRYPRSRKCQNRYKDHVCMMFTTRDTKGHTEMCLTFIFKVNHQGQVTDFGFYEILDIVNVRIDTKIKSVACVQPELRKVIRWMSVTLSFKVNRQGPVIFFNSFDILNLENARIDTKIEFVSCLQPEIRKVMQNGVWPWFSRSCSRDRIFSLSPLDSLILKTYPRKIFSKNSDGKAKIQWGWYPLGVFGWRNTLGVWGLTIINARAWG